MSDSTSLGISKETQTRLKIIAALTNKKLYELINEATEILEEKYHIIHQERIENHE